MAPSWVLVVFARQRLSHWARATEKGDHTAARSYPVYNIISPIDLIPFLLFATQQEQQQSVVTSYERCFCVDVCLCSWGVCCYRHTRRCRKALLLFFKSSRSASQQRKRNIQQCCELGDLGYFSFAGPPRGLRDLNIPCVTSPYFAGPPRDLRLQNHYGACLPFTARRRHPFLPSSTRIELRAARS